MVDLRRVERDLRKVDRALNRGKIHGAWFLFCEDCDRSLPLLLLQRDPDVELPENPGCPNCRSSRIIVREYQGDLTTEMANT